MKKDKIQEEQQDIELSLETGEEQGGEKESPAEEALKETIKKIKETASEEDPRPSQQVNLRTILGGDIYGCSSSSSPLLSSMWPSAISANRTCRPLTGWRHN